MRIFYDVDTQNDFMNKDGALYVPGAEEIKPNLRKLTKYARENRIQVIGSVDKHFGTTEYKEREGELQKWGGPFPYHCMKNKCGQEKIFETVVRWDVADGRGNEEEFAFYIENPLTKDLTFDDVVKDDDLCRKVFYRLPYEKGEQSNLDSFRTRINQEAKLKEAVNSLVKELQTGVSDLQLLSAMFFMRGVAEGKEPPEGIYIEKQSYDVFTNPNTEELLTQAKIKEAVVYGVATDYCVKAAVLGMQKRGIQCYVVKDAIRGVSPETTRESLEEMVNAGAKLIKTERVLNGL